MRKTIGALALIMVGSAAAGPLQAQGRRGGPDLDEQMTALTEQLELNEEQAAEVRKILEVQGEKRQEAFQGAGGDRSAMRGITQEIQEETSLMLAEVLSEDQMATYEEILAERRQRRGPPPFG